MILPPSYPVLFCNRVELVINHGPPHKDSVRRAIRQLHFSRHIRAAQSHLPFTQSDRAKPRGRHLGVPNVSDPPAVQCRRFLTLIKQRSGCSSGPRLPLLPSFSWRQMLHRSPRPSSRRRREVSLNKPGATIAAAPPHAVQRVHHTLCRSKCTLGS